MFQIYKTTTKETVRKHNDNDNPVVIFVCFLNIKLLLMDLCIISHIT